MKLLTSIIVILACCPTAANAGYSFDEQTEYYSINQPDPQKLLYAIYRTLKDDCETQKRVFACTSTSQTITYAPKKIGMGICRVNKIKIAASVIYRIPVWKQKNEALTNTRTEWMALFKHSVAHEKKHGKIHNKHMRVAYKRLLKLEARCSRITREAKKIIEKANDRVRRDNKRLDSRENHAPSTFPNGKISNQ